MGAALTTGKKVKWDKFSLKVKKSLGEGGFGYVYLVKDKPTGQRYALKRILCQDPQALQVCAHEHATGGRCLSQCDRRLRGARLS